MTSRKQPPHRYDKRLWKAAAAWSSFQDVWETCDYILKEQIQPDAPIYYSLVTAICVLYARPFKRSRGIENLTVQFVPKKFRKLHKLLILFRDQMAAHVDADGARFQGHSANNVRLIVHDCQVHLKVHRVKFRTQGKGPRASVGLCDARIRSPPAHGSSWRRSHQRRSAVRSAVVWRTERGQLRNRLRAIL
jgi:hypothetical protein